MWQTVSILIHAKVADSVFDEINLSIWGEPSTLFVMIDR